MFGITPSTLSYILIHVGHPCIIQQAGNENTQTSEVEVLILILLQVLITNLQGNV